MKPNGCSTFYAQAPSELPDPLGTPETAENLLPESKNPTDADSNEEGDKPSTAEHSIADSTAPAIESDAEDSGSDMEDSVKQPDSVTEMHY